MSRSVRMCAHTWCNVLAGRKICLANMARRIDVMKRGWKEN
jgi:hypothetical protein